MDPIDFVAYGLLPWYPHMGTADAAIWDRYVRQNPAAFDKAAYDVPVGAGAPFDTTVNPTTGGNLSKLYRYKIDVVAEKNGELYVIEVKARAGPRAIEQVLGYARLAPLYLPDAKNPKALIVTDSLMPDMGRLAKSAGVELRVI